MTLNEDRRTELVSSKIEPELRRELEVLAKSADRSLSSETRRAIREYIWRQKRLTQSSRQEAYRITDSGE